MRNALGDIRAEADNAMLSRAFLETADYRTLVETSDRTVIVGRRGTGKSALALQLRRFLDRDSDTVVISIIPEEHQTIGLRPHANAFGTEFSTVRAGARIAWRYALVMETALALSPTYSFRERPAYARLAPHVDRWRQSGTDVFHRYRSLLIEHTKSAASPEELIGNLPHSLHLKEVEEALREATERVKETVAFLIDGLDEGYRPDTVGTALIDGLLQASIDLKTRIPCVKPMVFLRDNILRAVQLHDHDYSKSIEATVLRIHWDISSLFALATKRLRVAFQLPQEASRKIWDACVSPEMAGIAGFKRCLQHTLYRPRDLIALLNDAIHASAQHQSTRVRLVKHDIENSARRISVSRLDDVQKEYGDILAGLPAYIGAFRGVGPALTPSEADVLLDHTLTSGSTQPRIQQEFDILSDPSDVLKGLYSVGFIGIKEAISDSYVFCHDGRSTAADFSQSGGILVHPCYWMALGIDKAVDLTAYDAEEIYDEYDIRIASETPDIRKSRIAAILSGLDEVPIGASGASQFEAWCADAIRICFAKGLRNVQLRPNRDARSRRDVVATNLAQNGAWQRIREDYGTRQVTFEVKNVEHLTSADYQQMLSYLGRDYGRVGFFIMRLGTTDLRKGKEVDWVRDIYSQHDALVIKMTAEFLKKQLRKLESPQKHDAVDDSIHSILDTYSRLYVVGQVKPSKSKRKADERRKMRKRKRRGKPKAASLHGDRVVLASEGSLDS